MKKSVLLLHTAADPYYNMAVDEYLFGRVMADQELIFLRLYRWSPGGITFGLNQKLERALDFDQLGQTPLIRRITGGRALYHDPTEITYSFSMRLNLDREEVAPLTAVEISHSIAIALVGALSELGIESNYARNSSASDKIAINKQKLPCFSSHARHEIISQKGKLVASAQRVIGDSFFQHGSLKPDGIVSHPALPNLPGIRLESNEIQHLNNLEIAGFGRLVASRLGSELGVDFVSGSLENSELETIKQLAKSVQKKNLEAREIIKQVDPESSLLK